MYNSNDGRNMHLGKKSLKAKYKKTKNKQQTNVKEKKNKH